MDEQGRDGGNGGGLWCMNYGRLDWIVRSDICIL
jgi:hypothetical protein